MEKSRYGPKLVVNKNYLSAYDSVDLLTAGFDRINFSTYVIDHTKVVGKQIWLPDWICHHRLYMYVIAGNWE